ncbi:hypothetical protein AAFF_G00402020 [Aldrovandia affinis]|uniref:Fucolectin tachylectin-4 pentraxin-1 domain-containing protein n=1 Tax=Aldrovandia affinis TaxID=143900 RepID=A0AAD7T7C5_9TELE|nr:hypothetical protein AAFF_G00402020 [Aldrovandia affinis]
MVNEDWFEDSKDNNNKKETVQQGVLLEVKVEVKTNAIDGGHETTYESRSCTQTELQVDPWWRVDLLHEFRVTSVTITNRGDCCPERLDGAEIRIGNSMENNGNNNPVCAVVSTIPAGESATFECREMEGRYVNIIRSGCYKFLTLCEVEVNATQTENAATGGKATQSSTGSGGGAERAIDRNRNPAYKDGFCSHTDVETDPWWRVDLLRKHRVTSVTITNSGDCCPKRLDGAQIRIGNSMENNGNNNPVCAVVSTIPVGESVTFQCHEMEGRYVNIIRPGCYKILTLCEVEVNASTVSEDIEMDPVTNDGDIFRASECSAILPDNAASGGKATQSSTGYGGGAERAIDGNRNPLYNDRSCTHTEAETDPWWRVDLLREHRVTSVTITNREDCCSERLDGAEIRIGNSMENNGNNNPVCAVVSTIPAGDSVTFQCHEMEGRYVNIIQPGCYKFLTLCEVEVNATQTGNAASGGKATQSSTAYGGSARRAIDRNRNPVYEIGYCTHTKGETDPWWRVDLHREHRVTSVTITNRGDCCPERLDGAEIRIGNSMENNGNNNPVCAVVSTIPAGESVTFQCHEMEGRYINVILPGCYKILTLCEIMQRLVERQPNLQLLMVVVQGGPLTGTATQCIDVNPAVILELKLTHGGEWISLENTE